MNRVCNIFAQLLQLFPRTQFQQAVRRSMPSDTPEGLPVGASLWP